VRDRQAPGSHGLVVASAIGAVLTFVYAWVITGGALETWPLSAYFFRFLLIFAPFGLVALIGSRDWRAWGAAFAFTLILWGPFLIVAARWHRG